jgi:hypothetical protein
MSSGYTVHTPEAAAWSFLTTESYSCTSRRGIAARKLAQGSFTAVESCPKPVCV